MNEVSAGRWFGTMWAYTLLRIALFAALWLLLLLVGLGGFLAPALAAVLSIPLSLVLLARPRRALAETMQQRIELRREDRADLDARLQGEGSADE